jgi:predicted transglutaminase-like cysteine proteinase
MSYTIQTIDPLLCYSTPSTATASNRTDECALLQQRLKHMVQTSVDPTLSTRVRKERGLVKLYIFVVFFLGRHKQVFAGLLLGSSMLAGAAHATVLHSPSKKTDEQAQQRLQDWKALVEQSISLRDEDKLRRVNAFFNSNILYGEDQDVWGQADYWASPQETLIQGAGDCEDFALAKYFTLRLLGITEKNLRLVYTTVSSAQQAHMILGFWPDLAAAPLLLDNLNPAILPISQRLDLHMQFAFGDTHLYRFEQNTLQAVGKTELLPHWTALLAKLENEGFLLANGNVAILLPLLQSSARHIPVPAG